MIRYFCVCAIAVALTFTAFGQTGVTFDQAVDNAITREHGLLTFLRGAHPVAETYIQEMEKNSDFGVVPKNDHYFLGKVDLASGVASESLLPKSGGKARALDEFTQLFSIRFLPRGFAQMMIPDNGAFDRAHYDFGFVRREFLGDLRTIVVSVSPKKEAGAGRFNGQIWIEDRDFNIVRFDGTYAGNAGRDRGFLHFDSWRIEAASGMWLPYEIYSEESEMPYDLVRHLHYKAITQLWGYTKPEQRGMGEFTNMTVELPAVEDHSAQAADYSPVERLRGWERQGEDNILARLENANLLASRGPVETILETVINNVVAVGNLNITPEVRARVLLTTPLETFTVGHTIVISRGLLDTLPDEASLAAMVTHELAHIALGQEIDTKFAFGDRMNFDDQQLLAKFRFARPQEQEDAANRKAMDLLEKSPYAAKLRQAGLFLKALGSESNRLPELIKPLMGSRMADGNNVLRLAALLETAPQLQRERADQIAALPLGTRTRLDPWTDQLRMAHTQSVPLLSAREKMPFEITPVFIHLTYLPDSNPTAAVSVEGNAPRAK